MLSHSNLLKKYQKDHIIMMLLAMLLLKELLPRNSYSWDYKKQILGLSAQKIITVSSINTMSPPAKLSRKKHSIFLWWTILQNTISINFLVCEVIWTLTSNKTRKRAKSNLILTDTNSSGLTKRFHDLRLQHWRWCSWEPSNL